MKTLKLTATAIIIALTTTFFACNSSTETAATNDSTTNMSSTPSTENSDATKTEDEEEDHHVGELGKGPNGGTIEEAEPGHIEIVASGKDLIFNLLDGDAKPVSVDGTKGSVIMQYADKTSETINMMLMDGKLNAMGANNGKAFTAVATITNKGQTYSATFKSDKDLAK